MITILNFVQMLLNIWLDVWYNLTREPYFSPSLIEEVNDLIFALLLSGRILHYGSYSE